MTEQLELKIPEGINYECSGCGQCCTGWTVPMTAADHARVSSVDWGKEEAQYTDIKLFRQLKSYEKAGTPYTHAILPGSDSFCPFLTDNLCFVHKQYGAKFKPSMCQLFPYCFNETPSGIYTTVSFVSMAVIYNRGLALTEQRDYLETKLKEFQALYPNHHPNWSSLQLAVGQPMTWDDYLRHEDKLTNILKDCSLPLEQRFLNGSDYLFSQLTAASGSASGKTFEALPAHTTLKHLDRHLLVALHKIYFPAKPLGQGECNFNIFRFCYQLAYQGTRISLPTRSFSLEELHEFPWPQADQEIEDLLFRYFLSRLFGKLYFGAGFGQLSLITGFHHLILVLALVKLHAKAWAASRQATQVSMLDLVVAIRELEKRLGESKLGGYEAALWELLMQSRSRMRRVLSFA